MSANTGESGRNRYIRRFASYREWSTRRGTKEDCSTLFFAKSFPDFTPECVNVRLIDNARRDVDEFAFGNNGFITLVQLVQHVDRLVAILIRVLYDGGDHITVFNPLQCTVILVERHHFNFAELSDAFETFENHGRIVAEEAYHAGDVGIS